MSSDEHLVRSPKRLVLGTAMWGWLVPRGECFNILAARDEASAINWIDCATNYPINGNQRDHGIALRWLSEWFESHTNDLCRVFVKVGSLKNDGKSHCDLSFDNLIGEALRLREILGHHLGGVGIHWDNRNLTTDSIKAFQDTVEFLRWARRENLKVGFSGVKDPQAYAELAPDLADVWTIQVRESPLSQSGREQLRVYFPLSEYWVYGINDRGLRMDSRPSLTWDTRGRRLTTDQIRLADEMWAVEQASADPPRSWSELAFRTVYSRAGVDGIIIGPRSVKQMEESVGWVRSFERGTKF